MNCERVAYADGLAAGLEAALEGVDRMAPPGRFAAVASGGRVEFVAGVRRSSNTELAVKLAAVRIGVTRKLLDRAVEYLCGRVVGGEPTIRKQLVLGALADAVVAIELLRQYTLAPYPTQAAVADAHDQITALDWEVIKLLGASGFIADGPATEVRLSELIANCWISREDQP